MRNKIMKFVIGRIMKKYVITLIAMYVFLRAGWSGAEEHAPDQVHLDRDDRILILAPHPDDEVIGCAGIIQEALKKDLPIRIVFLTYGDNNEWSFLLYRKHPVLFPGPVEKMGGIRHDEAENADKSLGVLPKDLIFLGYPDFKMLNMWYAHWGGAPPAMGMLSRKKKVPYGTAFRPGAPYKGEEVLKDLETIISGFSPTKIFLSHPADHNSDHRALYLFTRVALWDVGEKVKPEIYPYLVHYRRWPIPMGLAENDGLEPPANLKKSITWKKFFLTEKEVKAKFNALKLHKSQYRANKRYLSSFIRTNELFGDFPDITPESEPKGEALAFKEKREMGPMPVQLNEEEKRAFTGIEKHLVSVRNGNMVIDMTLSHPIKDKVGISIYLFGYKKGVDFSTMPKIHIKYGVLGCSSYNQSRKISPKDITAEIHRKRIHVEVPLKFLGAPDRILTSARTYSRDVPLDWVAWRVIILK